MAATPIPASVEAFRRDIFPKLIELRGLLPEHFDLFSHNHPSYRTGQNLPYKSLHRDGYDRQQSLDAVLGDLVLLSSTPDNISRQWIFRNSLFKRGLDYAAYTPPYLWIKDVLEAARDRLEVEAPHNRRTAEAFVVLNDDILPSLHTMEAFLRDNPAYLTEAMDRLVAERKGAAIDRNKAASAAAIAEARERRAASTAVRG